MRSLVLSSALVLSSITAINVLAPVNAAYAEASVAEHSFVKKDKKIKGGWSIIQRDGDSYIRFNDDFKTSNGPDLKVFLSPQTIEEVTGKTAIEGAINLGELISNKGSQEYKLPADLNASDFKSVLIHCEQYSKLWGGGAL
ncbi:DM13 domain-containing protein [Hirschia litorea]|uniref:DM13 domain-containing protein n=1 Tax=Hirschia litorea TaxID=1199156 RepID=A0ABW2ILN0_9PROT